MATLRITGWNTTRGRRCGIRWWVRLSDGQEKHGWAPTSDWAEQRRSRWLIRAGYVA